MAASDDTFTLGKAVLPVYLPAVFFAMGEGAIIPIIPAIASRLGADLAMAGVIAALLTIGSLIGNLPAGMMVARYGERNAMIGSAIMSGIGAIIAIFSTHLVFFALAIFVIGLGHSAFALARHAFMTTFVPISHRARALSTLGGAFRAGIFVGPFITALLLLYIENSIYVFGVMIFFDLCIIVLLLSIEDPTEKLLQARLASTASIPIMTGKQDTLWDTLVKFREALIRLGFPSAILAGLRTSRQVLLPLWAVSIGIGETETSIIIGIAGAVDFSLFYVGGIMMDRYGRFFTAVPSLLGLAFGVMALAFTHDLAGSSYWFFCLAVFLSIANGVSAGVLMTLGSDLAPKYNPAPFLGAWRVTSDAGQAITPLAIAGLTAIASISVASLVVGATGIFGAALYVRYLPRYDPLHPIRTQQRHERKALKQQLRAQKKAGH
ncbi:MAG: MFS transporter [Microbacteriaceae bacterium]